MTEIFRQEGQYFQAADYNIGGASVIIQGVVNADGSVTITDIVNVDMMTQSVSGKVKAVSNETQP